MTDDQIISELMNQEKTTIVQIEMKYKLTFDKAKQIYQRWVAAQPSERSWQEIFSEYYARYLNNPPIRDKPIKLRHTPFSLNGVRYDTFKDFESAKGQMVLMAEEII